MKDKQSFFFGVLAGACLLVIAFLVLTNYIRNSPRIDLKKELATRVLGESTVAQMTAVTQEGVKDMLQGTIESSKEVLTQKAIEAEKTVLKNMQKEVTNLTISQIDSLKLQICRDWGVLPVASGTPSPTPTETE